MPEENNQKDTSNINDVGAEAPPTLDRKESSTTPDSLMGDANRLSNFAKVKNIRSKKAHRPTWLRRSLVVTVALGLIAGFVGGLFGSGFNDNSGIDTANLAEQKKIVSSESQLIS